MGKRFRLKGAGRVRAIGRLELGLAYRGFTDHRAGGLIRIRGRLDVEGPVSVGHGNRWDVGPDAHVRVGAGTYFSADNLLIAAKRITFGRDCAVSWQCQFLDTDFHELDGHGEAVPIEIGDRVWFGTGTVVLKGARIADGCAVAANSTVTGQFDEPNCLMAGTPARVIRRGITWE